MSVLGKKHFVERELSVQVSIYHINPALQSRLRVQTLIQEELNMHSLFMFHYLLHHLLFMHCECDCKWWQNRVFSVKGWPGATESAAVFGPYLVEVFILFHLGCSSTQQGPALCSERGRDAFLTLHFDLKGCVRQLSTLNFIRKIL